MGWFWGQEPSKHVCRRSSSSSQDVESAVQALRSGHGSKQARPFNIMVVGRQCSGKSSATNLSFNLIDALSGKVAEIGVRQGPTACTLYPKRYVSQRTRFRITDTPGTSGGEPEDLADLQQWAQGVAVVTTGGYSNESFRENRADVIIIVVEMETLMGATRSALNGLYGQELREQVKHFRDPKRVGGPLPMMMFGNFPPNMPLDDRREAESVLRQVTELDTVFCGNLTLKEFCDRDPPYTWCTKFFDDHDTEVTVIKMLKQAARFVDQSSGVRS